jgi:Uma2 family endonuclease
MAPGRRLRYLEVAMASATLMSVEEFAALPEDGQMHELVEGELRTMPPPHSPHARALHRIFTPFAHFVLENGLGEAYAEAGYQLSDDPPTVRQPDISFQSKQKLAGQPEEGYFRGAPDLVIEILSPSDNAEDLRLKVRQYLAAGAAVVAVVYPKTREIMLHRPAGLAETLEIGQTLEFPDVAPGWSMPVEDVFAPRK